MEVEIPTSPPEFFFDSSCTSTPYVSAPSSPPRRLGDFPYFSAPTSPTRAAAAYAELRRLSLTPHDGAGAGACPFLTLASPEYDDKKDAGCGGGCDDDNDNFDFAFDFSGQLDMPEPTAAEELFEEGRIRTVRPRPRPASPRRAAHEEALSSRRSRKLGYNPFFTVTGEDTGGSNESAVALGGRSLSRRSTRSLSPNRIADFLWEESVQAAAATKTPGTSKADVQPPPPPAPPVKTSGRKWWFKDLLLFRSASEGRAVRGKDPLRKYTLLAKVGKDDSKESSFRSADGSVSGRGRSRSNGGSNRSDGGGGKDLRLVYRAAAGEERRRKTFLPYREGLLGCLGFIPSVHGLAKGLHSITQT